MRRIHNYHYLLPSLGHVTQRAPLIGALIGHVTQRSALIGGFQEYWLLIGRRWRKYGEKELWDITRYIEQQLVKLEQNTCY